MNYPLCSSTWDREEYAELQKVLESKQFTMGPRVAQFEKEFAEYMGVKHALMVNSGSSANLIAFTALLHSGDLRPGDEVIVPAVGWPTSYYPIHQNGLKLRFVDVKLDSLTISPRSISNALNRKSRAILAINLLGSSCNMTALRNLCKKKGLLLIEDNCEAMGATYGGKFTGTWGKIGTFSTFFSHHMNTMEGGLITTNCDKIHRIATMLRSHGWSREIDGQQFNFVLPGYNLRPTEFQGALGSVQLRKLDKMNKWRRSNAEVYSRLFGKDSRFTLQKPHGESSWFQLSFISNKIKKDKIINLLNSKNIETRPIMTGNFLRHPASKYLNHSVYGKLPNAEKVHRSGFLVGNHACNLTKQLLYLREVIRDV